MATNNDGPQEMEKLIKPSGTDPVSFMDSKNVTCMKWDTPYQAQYQTGTQDTAFIVMRYNQPL